MRPLCRHCRKRTANRPLGLCWTCYYRPGVRDLYPSTSKYARRGVGVGNRMHPPLPAEPTHTAPGSAPRIRVLEERAVRGEALFRPGDATLLEPAHAS